MTNLSFAVEPYYHLQRPPPPTKSLITKYIQYGRHVTSLEIISLTTIRLLLIDTHIMHMKFEIEILWQT